MKPRPTALEPALEQAAALLVGARAHVARPGGTGRPPSALEALVQAWGALPAHTTADRAAFALARRALQSAEEALDSSADAAADAPALLDEAIAALIAG